MASTYTQNTGIEKPGSGDQSGTWGVTANTNFDIIDRALHGQVSIAISGSQDLTTNDGSVSNGAAKVVVLTGSPGITFELRVTPVDQQKYYTIKNETDAACRVIYKGVSYSTSNGVEIASGSSAAVTGDGGGALGVFKSLTPNSDLVNDTSPQLGGPLDVNGQSIVSASNGNIAITPDGTGAVNITGTANITGDLDVDNLNLNGNSISATDTNGNISVSPDGSGHVIMSGLVYPNADGSANDFLKTDGTGNLSFGGQSLLFVPGMVMPYAGASSPTGWLTCYGQAISRTTYSALFAAIGTIHGAGDGSTTFNLPDLRGRTISGQDDMGGSSANRLTNQSGGVDGDTLGAAGGDETHTLTVPELPDSFYYNSNLNSVDDYVDNYANANFTARVADVISHTSQGGGGAHNNVQPTLILNYIIKT